MKIYLASRFSNHEKLNDLATTLAAEGHTVVSTWHRTEAPSPVRRDHPDYLDNSVRAAERDLREIAESDALILLTENCEAIPGGCGLKPDMRKRWGKPALSRDRESTSFAICVRSGCERGEGMLSSILRLGPLRSLDLAHLDTDILPHFAGVGLATPSGVQPGEPGRAAPFRRNGRRGGQTARARRLPRLSVSSSFPSCAGSGTTPSPSR